MPDEPTPRIRVSRQNGVATVTIDNPPFNVLDLRLVADIGRS